MCDPYDRINGDCLDKRNIFRCNCGYKIDLAEGEIVIVCPACGRIFRDLVQIGITGKMLKFANSKEEWIADGCLV